MKDEEGEDARRVTMLVLKNVVGKRGSCMLEGQKKRATHEQKSKESLFTFVCVTLLPNKIEINFTVIDFHFDAVETQTFHFELMVFETQQEHSHGGRVKR